MSDPAKEFGDDDGNRQFLRLVEEIWPELSRDRIAEGPQDDRETTEVERGETPEATPRPRIGRFEVVRELGRGGGGVVLLVFDPRLRRHVAMKVPGPEGLMSTRLRRRFLREARAVAALRHANIIAIHEAGEAGPIPYLIMEHCDGGSLAGWLAARPADCPLSPQRAARLVARLADAVQHAHDRGVLHRDLKPANILLRLPARPGAGPEGSADDDPLDREPLVSDFGLARVPEAGHDGLSETVEGVPLGTIAYMSAEAARCDHATIGPATDVYGLGVILFELLTGRRPFEGPGRGKLLEQITSAEPPSPRAFRDDVPLGLETICLRCLRKRASERYQTPAELAEALRCFDDADSAPIGRAPKSPRRRRGTRSRVVVAVVASVLALAGAAFLLWPARSAGRRSGDLPAHVPKIDPRDAARTDGQTARSGFDELLKASPGALAPIARALQGRMSDLPARLRHEIAAPRRAGESAENHDRRRASAACALLVLGAGSEDEAWSLLRFAPDPQVRSFLIHRIGPAGIAPQRIVDRLAREGDPSTRRALVQVLGEIPDPAWPAGLRDRAGGLALGLYEHDPDPGVHGSARWLLSRWGHDVEWRRLDDRLAHAASPPGRRWRISPSGLTLVVLHDQEMQRTIEIADTEVTLDLFQQFRAGHDCPPCCERGPEYPVTCVDFVLAAEFCNWLGRRESLSNEEMAYRVDRTSPVRPVEYRDGCSGYRLPTIHEYELACRAGTKTPRYYGSADALLASYAWYGSPYEVRLRPVARLKPNDLGLFDMLGNADELCQAPQSEGGDRDRVYVCGGSVLYNATSIRSNEKRGRISMTENGPLAAAFGFRVVRTRTEPD